MVAVDLNWLFVFFVVVLFDTVRVRGRDLEWKGSAALISTWGER